MACVGYDLVGGVAVGQVNDDLVPREARARWGDDAVGSAFALVSNLFRTMKHARKLNIHGQTCNIINNKCRYPESIITCILHTMYNTYIDVSYYKL